MMTGRYRLTICDNYWERIEQFFLENDPRPFMGECYHHCNTTTRRYYSASLQHTTYVIVVDTNSSTFKDAVKHQSYFS